MAEQKVTTKVISFSELVRVRWGKEWSKPEIAYEFSNGRKFEEPRNPSVYANTWDRAPDTWDQWGRWA